MIVRENVEIERIELCPLNYAYRATLIDKNHVKDYTPEFGLTQEEAFKNLERKMKRGVGYV